MTTAGVWHLRTGAWRRREGVASHVDVICGVDKGEGVRWDQLTAQHVMARMLGQSPRSTARSALARSGSLSPVH
jgi:hypothetical protein